MTEFQDPPDAANGKARIIDVAKVAGVSPSTVSYVITGKRAISPGTRRRVEAGIRALGYQRGGNSPAALPGRTGVLALTTPLYHGPNEYAEMEFFAAVTKVARELHFDLLLVIHDEGPSGLHRVTSAALADAVIVTDVADRDPRVPILLASGRPAVLVGVPSAQYGLTCITLDFTSAGEECGNHLADLGHRSIVHTGASLPVHTDHRRPLPGFLEGFETVAARRAVKAIFRPCAQSAESAARCLDELLLPGGPTALIVHDESSLSLFLTTMEHRGMRAPEDLSIIGVCSDNAADRLRIRPTAVVVPARQLGSLAVRRAVQLLDGEPPAEVDLVVPLLVIGDSTTTAPVR